MPYSSEFGAAAGGIGSNMTILKLSKLSDPTATHELGHNLGLYHTRAKTNGSSNKEHTTREETLSDGSINLDFNAKTADDEVVDTAANTAFRQGPGFFPFVESDCTYSGDEQDELGVPYVIIQEDVINNMSDAYAFDCQSAYLTPGQGHRMRETIQNDNDLIVAATTVASLYEPYKGEYYLVGPASNQIKPPLFQPGFEYKFVECCCNYPQPADYYDTSYTFNSMNILNYAAADETDYGAISHPNHSAILITEVEDALGNSFARKCYDNWNRSPSGGMVTRFNDGTFNTNVTVTPKDSLGINNQSLINDLPSGLYTIDKEYDDGATQQTVLLKQNNE